MKVGNEGESIQCVLEILKRVSFSHRLEEIFIHRLQLRKLFSFVRIRNSITPTFLVKRHFVMRGKLASSSSPMGK